MNRFMSTRGSQVLEEPEDLAQFTTFLAQQEAFANQRELSVVSHIVLKPSVLDNLRNKISGIVSLFRNTGQYETSLPEIIADFVVKNPVHLIGSFGVPSLVSGAIFAKSMESASPEYFLYGAITGLGLSVIGFHHIVAIARGRFFGRGMESIRTAKSVSKHLSPNI